MQRQLKQGMGLLLIVVLVSGIAAVGSARFASIAGDYQIDISRMGMPLVFYLRVDTDGGF
jgi:hypothetical protein